jgi:hypothetical protein
MKSLMRAAAIMMVAGNTASAFADDQILVDRVANTITTKIATSTYTPSGRLDSSDPKTYYSALRIIDCANGTLVYMGNGNGIGASSIMTINAHSQCEAAGLKWGPGN